MPDEVEQCSDPEWDPQCSSFAGVPAWARVDDSLETLRGDTLLDGGDTDMYLSTTTPLCLPLYLSTHAS